MFLFWPLLAAGVAGAASLFGQRQANVQNVSLAREQMAFQERMSSTAYQRSMSDMREAGLNPMLAFQQGGASSPGGAMARVDSVVEPAVSTALSSRRMHSELKNMAAQRVLMDNQAQLAANASVREASTAQVNYKQQTLQELQAEILRLQLPALQNSARVEQSNVGRGGAFLDRIRQMVLGGRGFFNPIGGGR